MTDCAEVSLSPVLAVAAQDSRSSIDRSHSAGSTKDSSNPTVEHSLPVSSTITMPETEDLLLDTTASAVHDATRVTDSATVSDTRTDNADDTDIAAGSTAAFLFEEEEDSLIDSADPSQNTTTTDTTTDTTTTTTDALDPIDAAYPTSASDPASTAQQSMRSRVKVYEMGPDVQWVDKGTGHIVCVYIETLDGFRLIVRSEVDGSIIMSTTVAQDISYQRQEETLIVWTEPDVGDLALSFQEITGCSEMWDHISEIQSRIVSEKIADMDKFPIAEDLLLDDAHQITIDLPDPELKNLADIEKGMIHAIRSTHIRDMLARYIKETGYIDKLLLMLEICEDLESTSDLFVLSSIVRNIIFLNDQKIYEHILSDEVFPLVVGALEYDREFPHAKANHREYLATQVRFKQVVPITSEQTVKRIKQTYRVQYLRDVVLARVLDDQTFSALNSIAYFNNLEIAQSLWRDDELLDNLFNILNQEGAIAEKKKDAILFLNDLTTIARALQKHSRSDFYRAFGNHGLFSVFEYTLGDEDEHVRVASLSILYNILDHDSSLARSFCLAQVKEGQRPLIDFLIERFLKETDSGLRSQIADCIRCTLDTSGVDLSNSMAGRVIGETNADHFQQLFYGSHCKSLFAPMSQLDKQPLVDKRDGSQVMELDSRMVSICSHLCELLCFTITQHALFIKNFMLHEPILRNMSMLLRAKETHLRLSALRVLRTCIGTNDHFYYRVLIQADVFGLVFAALLVTKGKPNLFNSACLEFFEAVRKASSSRLVVAHVVENFHKFFSALEYVDTFKQLHLTYEQQLEVTKGDEDQIVGSRKSDMALLQKDGWAKMDTNEEAYFNTSDDDEASIEEEEASDPSNGTTILPTLTTSLTHRPLVDYPDDDADAEDEDDKLESIGTKRRSTHQHTTKPLSQRFTITLGSANGHGDSSVNNSKSTEKIDNGDSSVNSKSTEKIDKGGIVHATCHGAFVVGGIEAKTERMEDAGGDGGGGSDSLPEASGADGTLSSLAVSDGSCIDISPILTTDSDTLLSAHADTDASTADFEVCMGDLSAASKAEEKTVLKTLTAVCDVSDVAAAAAADDTFHTDSEIQQHHAFAQNTTAGTHASGNHLTIGSKNLRADGSDHRPKKARVL
ncbi:hypothetical protein BASA81_014111 [Batrachochytrium salamandrivorans]|nr:hypothetical protein BASA81_014111 [Batrachochytrium salamandrivorans]